MGSPPDSDRSSIQGHEPLHRVAQSYLGTLWIAGKPAPAGEGELVLLRRLALPDSTPMDARLSIAQAGRDARRLRHDNVLSVLTVLDEDGLLAMSYEHQEAEPLRSLQSWANLRCLTFPIGVSLRILSDLLDGAHALHLGHAAASQAAFGGLSPDSVLVSRDGRTRLCDPLIAGSASLLQSIGCNTAKLAYAAPEQVRPGAPLSARTDVFTCGAMLWELLATRRLLTGSRPAIEKKLLEHDFPSLGAHLRADQQATPALVELVDRALAADPETRPQSALELAELLAGVGHELASREEVAHFVGRLSGQRFDRRSAAVRSKSLPQLETTLKWPIELPTTNGSSRRGARPATSSSAGVETPRTESQSVPVEPPTPRAFEPPAEVVEPALSLLPAHPALWKTQIAEAAPATPARAPRPAGGRTVSGIGTPAHSVLTPSLPFSHLTPAPFAPKWQSSPPSAMHIGPAETRARDSQPPTPQSSASNLPSFTEAEPILRAPVRYSRAPASSAPRVGGLARARVQAQQLWRRATASVPSAFSRPRVWLGVLGAVLALGSASSVVLALRGPGADAKTLNAATPTPVQAEPPAVTTEASTAWVALPSREPSRPGPAADEPDAAATSQRASPPTEAPDTEAPGTEKVSTDIHATRLSDPQLVELFELEHRRELPSCSARLAASGFDYPGIRPKAAVLALKAARQQMMRGKTDAAYLALCRATALNPAHTGAQQTLAELALQLGDPARAKAAAEEALLAAPADPELLGVLGDAVALAGDIAESRRIWLRTLPDKGTEAERLRRLASSYRGIGARALSRSHWAQARSYYRRALIASAGGVTASLGLSEALIRLKHMRAGLVWAERAAHAFPRDSRAQLLLGDALYGNGQREAARAAWRKALQVQPKNRMAARRLRQGKP